MTYTFKFLLQENRYSEIYIGHLRLYSFVELNLKILLQFSAFVFIVTTYLATGPVNFMFNTRHLQNISEQMVNDSMAELT
jgi:hypothetical protein